MLRVPERTLGKPSSAIDPAPPSADHLWFRCPLARPSLTEPSIGDTGAIVLRSHNCHHGTEVAVVADVAGIAGVADVAGVAGSTDQDTPTGSTTGENHTEGSGTGAC